MDAILRAIFGIDVEPDKPPLVRVTSSLAAAVAKASDAPLRPLSAAHDSVQEFTFAVRGRMRYMHSAIALTYLTRRTAPLSGCPRGEARRRHAAAAAAIAGAVRAQTDWPIDVCACVRVWCSCALEGILECGAERSVNCLGRLGLSVWSVCCLP